MSILQEIGVTSQTYHHSPTKLSQCLLFATNFGRNSDTYHNCQILNDMVWVAFLMGLPS